jgi:glucarate dehydratase
LRISDLRATTVSVPLEAPLRHAHGAHWGRFVRTIVELETDDGLVGLGELGGEGQSARGAVEALKPYLLGHDPLQLESLRFKICNPTASLYNNRVQVHAAIEFACLDVIGKSVGLPVHALLGGKLRETVPFASYLFFRYADPATGRGEVRTADQVVAHAEELRLAHGFRTHKLKGGVYPPRYELDCYRELAAALPEDRFRYDPNAVCLSRRHSSSRLQSPTSTTTTSRTPHGA